MPFHRILHVTHSFSSATWSGRDSSLLALVRAQQAQGWQPEIHTMRDLEDEGEEIIGGVLVRRHARGLSLPWKESRTKQSEAEEGAVVDLGLASRLAREKEVRLVHLHCVGPLAWEALTLARLRSWPVILSLPPLPIKELFGGMAWWKRWFGPMVLLERVDGVVCASAEQCRQVAEMTRREDCISLGPAVELSRAGGQTAGSRAKLRLPGEAFVIGCFSRIGSRRGQKILLEAFHQLAIRSPLAHLFVLGNQEERFPDPSWRKSLANSPFRDRILHPGYFPHGSEALRNAFDATDVVVVPSMEDHPGTVLVEAWAAHKPVLVSRTPAFKTLGEEGINVLMFEPGDSLELALRLEELWEDEPYREILAANGRIKAQQNHDSHRLAQRLELIYRQVENLRAKAA